jgi:hypothetical protein
MESQQGRHSPAASIEQTSFVGWDGVIGRYFKRLCEPFGRSKRITYVGFELQKRFFGGSDVRLREPPTLALLRQNAFFEQVRGTAP